MDVNTVSVGDVGGENKTTNAELPTKTGFWPKLSSILFREVNVTLSEKQQKAQDELQALEDKLNEDLEVKMTPKQQSIIDKMKAFWLQEIRIGKKD